MPPDRSPPAHAVTRLLDAVREGDRGALDRLFPLVYDELRGIARGRLRGGAGDLLQPTALVHEAYVKLSGGARLDAGSRAHFFALASRAMRQVLADQARARAAVKRGGGWRPTTLVDAHEEVGVELDDVLALEEALESLEARQRRIVEYRFFGGMEEAEIADLLGVSERTVRREWVKARAWLFRALLPGPPPLPPVP